MVDHIECGFEVYHEGIDILACESCIFNDTG